MTMQQVATTHSLLTAQGMVRDGSLRSGGGTRAALLSNTLGTSPSLLTNLEKRRTMRIAPLEDKIFNSRGGIITRTLKGVDFLESKSMFRSFEEVGAEAMEMQSGNTNFMKTRTSSLHQVESSTETRARSVSIKKEKKTRLEEMSVALDRNKARAKSMEKVLDEASHSKSKVLEIKINQRKKVEETTDKLKRCTVGFFMKLSREQAYARTSILQRQSTNQSGRRVLTKDPFIAVGSCLYLGDRTRQAIQDERLKA